MFLGSAIWYPVCTLRNLVKVSAWLKLVNLRKIVEMLVGYRGPSDVSQILLILSLHQI